MNMDHMFIMRLAALLFGGGIASCLFPGKSRMSHVLFLLLVLAETAVAHATIPDGWWFLLPGVVSVLLRLSFKGGTESGKGGKALLSLHATDGTIIRYYYWFSNFLVYGGAGSGKTKSIGKPLMEQYIRSVCDLNIGDPLILTNDLLDGLFAVGCHRSVTASLLLQLLFLAVGHVLADGGFEQPAGELCSADNQR